MHRRRVNPWKADACGPTEASGPTTQSRFRLVSCGLPFTHGLAIEFEAVGVVDEAVENGVGEGWIADQLVPLVERKLAGHEDGEVLAAGLLSEGAGQPTFADATRNRDILPCIRRRRDGSIIRSIPGVVRQSPSLGATGTAMSRS